MDDSEVSSVRFTLARLLQMIRGNGDFPENERASIDVAERFWILVLDGFLEGADRL
jgi:hypothetical protein